MHVQLAGTSDRPAAAAAVAAAVAAAAAVVQVNLSEEVSRCFKPLYVESWFSADVKLGALALHLDTPKCFAAEAYARKDPGSVGGICIVHVCT